MRGYTGHEHLDDVGLIHMNGRVHDPSLGRMLSPDPITQSPENAQDYNRYAYVMNNPLRFVDPSGYEGCEIAIPGATSRDVFNWHMGVLFSRYAAPQIIIFIL
ncbi:MAG: RHS repeat-associated core domain-containing protein [Gammaproteobacteria bacterium]|nr:RHS repeat-associated core domain-containing protein [Gammaproteobacteria bacterium]